MSGDLKTAAAFAESWNRLPPGPVYSHEQFEEWLYPVTERDVRGRDVLELGCGNASLLVHIATWSPARLEGVELGDAVKSARRNMESSASRNWKITRADLTTFASPGFDLVYCIGVLHHLARPREGLEAVLRNTKPGGRFHCWVYAREGNTVILLFIEPLRRVCSLLPWWVTRYLVAAPLSVPFFAYAKLLARLPSWRCLEWLPLRDYCRWIARRDFHFFWHVAFDQLVTPRTHFFRRETLEQWLAGFRRVEPSSTYIVQRNGNSWKFGGRIACAS